MQRRHFKQCGNDEDFGSHATLHQRSGKANALSAHPQETDDLQDELDNTQLLVPTAEASDRDAHWTTMTATMLVCIAVMAATYATPRHNRDVPLLTMQEASEKMKTRLKTDKAKRRVLKLRRGITMDSGAGHSVMPRRMVINPASIRESVASKAGVNYVAANNGRIPNEGEADLEFQTTEGHDECLTFQIAEVNKALGAVSHLVDLGYKVVFDKDMVTGKDLSVMTNKKTNVTSRFRRERNVWVLDAYVSAADDAENKNSDFHRRG